MRARDELSATVLETMEVMKRLGYIDGYLAGLWHCVISRNGELTLGAGGQTYRQAVLRFLAEQDNQPPGHPITETIADIRREIESR